MITYQAPDAAACQIQVSTNSSYLPLVYDVDPLKFSGANLDSRSSSLNHGKVRVVIVGKRSAEHGIDTIRYSRALQANTQHFFQITCNGNGNKVSGQFTTNSIPLGETYSDPAPVDPTLPGEYAWPTLSLSDRSQQIIDPQTGVLIRRMSLPGDHVVVMTNQPFAVARSAVWASPGAALTNTDGSSGATIAGNNAGNLFLGAGNGNILSEFHGTRANNFVFMNWFQVAMTATTSNSSCSSSVSDDCKVVVCLTIDGVNCNPNGKSIEQALTTVAQSYPVGTVGTAIDLWQVPGKRPFNGSEVAMKLGQVTCNGGPTVTLSSGDYFATYWTAGSVITINNVDYPVAQVNTSTSLQVAGSCPSTSTPVNYTATNFGALVRKKTTSLDTINVQYAAINYELGAFPFFDYSGDYDLCSVSTTVGPTGNAGYNCALINGGGIYWVDSKTGESHQIALNQALGNPNTAGCGSSDSIQFDPVLADTWYCAGPYPQKVQYFGNHLEPTNVPYAGQLLDVVNIPTCNAPTSPTNQPCLWFTPLTGTSTIATLTQAFDSLFQPAGYQYWQLSAVENGNLVMRTYRGGYGSLGWTVIFSPTVTANGQVGNTGCVGGGQPGCVIAAMPSWARPNARWCPQKGNDPMFFPGWEAIGTYYWGSPTSTAPGTGPYVSSVSDNTSFIPTLGAFGGPQTCPQNAFGISGEACTSVYMDGEPRDPSPCTSSTQACGGAVETGYAGELGNAQPGDFFTVGPNSPYTETLRLLAKQNNYWTWQRGVNGVLSTTGPSPLLYVSCNINQTPGNPNLATEIYWNYAGDPHGNNISGSTVAGDPGGTGAHFFMQSGVKVESYSLDARCPQGQICYQARGTPPSATFNAMLVSPAQTIQQSNPAFNGKAGAAYGNNVQSHPAGPGMSATGLNASYYFDGRPFNGGPLSGSGSSDGSNPATPLGGQLWKFTAAQVPSLNRKLMPTMALAGAKPLLDVSTVAPGTVITGLPQDSYKYCVANAANECTSGSAVGDVYINAPYVDYPFCHYAGQATGMPDQIDLCVGDNAMIYGSVMQLTGTVTDLTGASQRTLGKGLSRPRIANAFWHVHALANSGWLMFKDEYSDEIGDMVFSMEIPAPSVDSVVRTGYEPLLVKLPVGPKGTVNAFMEFGYQEYGAPVNLNCTSRQEACVTVATGAVDPVNPFFFETSEAGLIQGVPCAAGCSITIPAIPQHVLVAKAVYRNAANQVLLRTLPYVFSVN